MNLLLAVTLAVVDAILLSQNVYGWHGPVDAILRFAVQINFVLFFFNLLPLPPLDGGHVAQSFVPYRQREQFDQFARYAPFVLLGIIMIPSIGRIFTWPAQQLTIHLFALLGLT
jgi:Zn-dependent protease